mgnify:CR=1 FL=1
MDWARLIEELHDHGWTVYRIAERLNRKWDTVNRWKTSEPKHSDGEALKKLHEEVTQPVVPGST